MYVPILYFNLQNYIEFYYSCNLIFFIMPLVNAEVRCFRIRTEKQNKNKKEKDAHGYLLRVILIFYFIESEIIIFAVRIDSR